MSLLVHLQHHEAPQKSSVNHQPFILAPLHLSSSPEPQTPNPKPQAEHLRTALGPIREDDGPEPLLPGEEHPGTAQGSCSVRGPEELERQTRLGMLKLMKVGDDLTANGSTATIKTD